jgi:hypothetical protein
LNTLADGLSGGRTVGASVVPFRRPVAAPRAVFRWAALAAAGLLMTAGLGWFALQEPQAGSSGPVVTHESPAPASPVVPPPPPALEEKPAPLASADRPQDGPQTTPERIAGPSGGTSTKRPELVKAVLALSLTVLRGAEEIEEFPLAPGADIAEIQIDLEGLEDSGSFQAAVRSKDKGIVWEQSGIKGRPLDWTTAALVLEVPAKLLTPGRYEVAVTTETEEMVQEFEVVPGDR